jgi:hypothetical protein
MQSQNTLIPFFARTKEVWLICFLSGLAAFHVLIFSAAFPFFANTDEHYHFDLVVKYSHLQVPKQTDYLSPESLQYIAIFSSWEYLYTNDTFAAPPWKLPASEMKAIVLSREMRWRLSNYESDQPPLYYLAVGGWWKLFSALGFHDAFLLYLARFFNAWIISTLVWLAWLTARLIFPENIFIRIAVPALAAFMPQSIFYTLNNDVFSPLCFGAAFLCLAKFWRSAVPSVPLAMATGLVLAATFLTKTSNLPLLAVSGGFTMLKIVRMSKEGQLRASASPLALLFFSALLPMAAWMAWCRIHFGDYLGSALLARQLGWTIKPFSEWWHHPIFTLSGLGIFLSGNLNTFWQGEMIWHDKSLLLPPINLFYTLMSAILIAGALLHLKRAEPFQKLWLRFSLAAVAAEIAFFALLSIIYDFHDCYYPSRENPYFLSGRYLLGALIPFLLLLAFALDGLLIRLGTTTKFIALTALILTMCLSEIAIDWPIFSSQYNWFNI